MPVATRRMSAVRVCAPGLSRFSTVISTALPVFLAADTLWLTRILKPRLSNARPSSFEISASHAGTRRGRYSTMVTSTPSAL
jgi:hypothetical protein